MNTRILKINPLDIDSDIIDEAAGVLRGGGLVAFPTETVYGLGANALRAEAVAKIFGAKQRPLDDPMIVHISRLDDLSSLAREIPPEALKLGQLLWPGPLTMVLEKTDILPDIVTSGLDTVAVRMPSGAVAARLIAAAGVPVAAPSANMFGGPSPTRAQHVMDDLHGRIDMILDGGATEIGIESTVVEFSRGQVAVLRPGGIDMEKLRDILKGTKVVSAEENAVNSPGKYPRHYSPRAKVIIVEEGPQQADKVLAVASETEKQNQSVGVISTTEHAEKYSGLNVKILGSRGDGKTCASRLFHILREFDSEGADIIVTEAICEKGLGLAVMNRLRKAAMA